MTGRMNAGLSVLVLFFLAPWEGKADGSANAGADALVAAVADTAAPPNSRAKADDQIEDIIVVARKTRERLEDVPLSITALDGRILNDNLHIRVEDLNGQAPSMNIITTNGHQASYTLRGLGANVANDGLEGSAGVFLDGVYLGRPGMAATDLVDIDQIEILRGPQGTLFGKNTTAGVVNITTQPPSFTPGAIGEATYGNYDYRQWQGSVTGPLLDSVLAARLTAYKTDRQGTVLDTTTDSHINTLFREGARGQLLYQPQDNFSLRIIGEYSREQQSTGAVLMVPSLGATPAKILALQAALGGTLQADPKGKTTTANGPAETGTLQDAVTAEANWSVGDVKVTSISAYRHWFYNSNADSLPSSVYDPVGGGYRIHDTQISEELRAALPDIGPVDSVVGLYYFRQDLTSDLMTLYGAEAAEALSSLPAALLVNSPYRSLLVYNNTRWDTDSTPQTRSYSGFGQSVWHIDRRWNLTAGIRETYETKAETVSRADPINQATGDSVPALASAIYPATAVSTSSQAPSFLLSSDYHLTPEQMLYGFVSRGYKAGGVNAGLPPTGLRPSSLIVRPEIATDYELGVKNDLFDHRVLFNVNLFYTDVNDYQANAFQTIPGSSNLASVLANVGRVVTDGAEVEITAKPVSGLTLRGSGSYDEATYQDYPKGPCPAEAVGRTYCDLTGRPLAFAPKWIANLDLTYERPVGAGFVAYTAEEFAWRSRFYASIDDSRYARTGYFYTVNLRAGLRPESGRWDIAIWGKNVLDRHYVVNYLNYGSLLPGSYAAFFADPATFGATLSLKY